MCKIRIKHWLGEGQPITKTYQVLSYMGEIGGAWMFCVKPLYIVVHGKKVVIDEPELPYGLPKKKEVGKDRNRQPIYEDLPEPSFLDKMRKLAIEKGEISVHWDDLPPMQTRKIPF